MCVIHDMIWMESEMYLFLTTDYCTISFFPPFKSKVLWGTLEGQGLCSSISCLFIF